MAIAPLQLPGYAAPQSLDFTSLANLGQVYKKAAAEQGLREAFAGGVPTDAAGLSQLGARVGEYNPQLGLSLAQLGMNAGQREQDRERQARQDAHQLEREKVTDANSAAYLRIAQSNAARANEDKPIIKEGTDPNTGATSFVRINPRTGELSPLGLQPSGSGTNPKSPFNQALFKADAERVNSYSEGAKLAEEGTATLDTIDNLRKSAYTAPVIGPLAAKLGHPATQALEASTNSLALDVAQKMKGSLSDKDIGFVKSQVPTAATGGAAGEQASGAIRAGFERTKQRAQFYRTWAEQNGNINGADAAWSKYSQENPLTVEDKDALGGRRFNPNYNKDFSPYLRISRQPQQTQGITQQQYEALPSGSTCPAPDGTQRIKP